jgi:putative spermidine/putrescine transport system substrate-binding protein
MSEIATRIAATVAVALLLGAGLWWWTSREPDRIVVVSWGGEYARAQAIALFHPYTDDSGVAVRVGLYGGGLTELTRQLESGQLEWDVVDFELPDAAEACRKGLIETIDATTLPKGDNGAPAAADFVPGAIGPCWVGSVVYSQLVAFDPKRFPQALPTRAADFFDLAAFPGGRGMKDAPKGNLELALIAAGVPAKGMYEVLSTPEGVARAFAKLESIRAAIVWWHASDEAIAMLADGRAVMTTALNGRVMDAIGKDRRTIGVIWDGQRYELDVFGIVRGTRNKEHALDFIRYATATRPLTRIAELLPYGPARRSSLPIIAYPKPSATNVSALPSAHMETAVLLDPDWWAVHGPAIEARWREWRSGQ